MSPLPCHSEIPISTKTSFCCCCLVYENQSASRLYTYKIYTFLSLDTAVSYVSLIVVTCEWFLLNRIVMRYYCIGNSAQKLRERRRISKIKEKLKEAISQYNTSSDRPVDPEEVLSEDRSGRGNSKMTVSLCL